MENGSEYGENGMRKTSARQTEDSENRSDFSDRDSESSGRTEDSKSRSDFSDSDFESSGRTEDSESRSDFSDSDFESSGRTEDSNSRSNFRESDFEAELKRRKMHDIASESITSSTDWPRHTPDARVRQIFVRDDDDIWYGFEPEGDDDEHVEDDVLQDIEFCEVCGECDREDRMLVCDLCDAGCHMPYVPIFLGIKSLWGYGTASIASGSSLSKEHEWLWPWLARCERLLGHGFEVLTAAVMKTTIFWDITPCGPLRVN
jgi:hypothetical protein